MDTRAGKIYSAARDVLRSESKLFTPLQVLGAEFLGSEPADAVLDIGYRERCYRFLVEMKARTAPSVVKETIQELSDRSIRAGSYPLLLVPYLSQTIVSLLENADVSGIDLNGNYLILLPDFVAIRLDRKNKYTESRDIKKVYSGNSSIVGRMLLRENRSYSQVTEINEAIALQGGGISLSTVSKVLTALQEDLLIEKRSDRIRVLQADALLERLTEGYRAPRVSETLKLKLPGDREEQEAELNAVLGQGRWVWDGVTSAERYTVTTPAPARSAYTNAEGRVVKQLRAYENPRFYNCIVKRTKDAFVYFDSRDPWSAPLECYLALMQLDKREREIAQPLGDEILKPFS